MGSMKETQGRRMMPTTSVRVVAVIAMACLVLAATARGNVEVGEVGEYWHKRTQEARLRNQGGPLHDLVAAATRFHQDLLHRANGRRSALDAEARTQQTTSTPAQAEASSAVVEGGDDHQLVQDPAIIRN